MNRKNIFCIILLIIYLFAPVNNLLAETITFGSLSASFPISYKKGNKVKGFLPDVFLETARRAGFKIRIKSFPVVRLKVYIEKGIIDGTVFLLPKEDVKKYIMFSQIPIITSRNILWTRKVNKFNYKRVEDLYGKRLGMVLGWKFTDKKIEKAIKENKIYVDVASAHDLNLKKLMADRVDMILGTELVTNFNANNLGINNKIFMVKVISEISAFYGVGKNSKNINSPGKFIKTMDKAFREIISDGTYYKIMKSHRLTLQN